jgi:arylsulfatase A-like enzyme
VSSSSGTDPGKSLVSRPSTRPSWPALFSLLTVAAAVVLAYLRFPTPAESTLCEGCNVVLVSLDTLRADHLGCYGYDRPTSPNIDEFASRSYVFEDAISQSAWTRPAHASMLTGYHPAEHGIVTMLKNAVLRADVSTLPAVLGGAGYRTAAFTGGANMAAEFGFDNGFEVFESPGRRIEDHLAGIDDWLAKVGDAPFFLMVHGFDPHRPYKSNPLDRRALGLGSAPARGINRICTETKSRAAMAPFVAEYDAAIHRGDRGFGELLDLLRTRNLDRRTVVVVTSDHGEEFLEHGRCFHIRTLYREVLRVPLILHVPGTASARIAGVVPASVSIGPTILELVGVASGSLPGPSLVSSMRKGRGSFPFVVSETGSRVGPQGYGHVRAMTTDREKLIHWIDQDRFEYFDLVSDPYERSAVAEGAEVEAMKARLARWTAAHPRRVHPGTPRPVPAGVRRALRALGYVTEDDGRPAGGRR